MEKFAKRITISDNNLRMQSFAFPPNFMDYLIENANDKIMRKFHRCCKYLYQVAPFYTEESDES